MNSWIYLGLACHFWKDVETEAKASHRPKKKNRYNLRQKRRSMDNENRYSNFSSPCFWEFTDAKRSRCDQETRCSLQKGTAYSQLQSQNSLRRYHPTQWGQPISSSPYWCSPINISFKSESKILMRKQSKRIRQCHILKKTNLFEGACTKYKTNFNALNS